MSVIVYTTIFGGSDSLKPAPTGADECVCFTDDLDRQANGWSLVRANNVTDPRRDAWQMRCVPHIVFPDGYSRVVWIDASFTLVDLPLLLKDAGKSPIAALRHHERFSAYREGERLVKIGQSDRRAITRQLDDYRRMDFSPRHLSISCVLVRDRSRVVERFNETWWRQIEQYPGDNTQVSLDFSAWRHGIEIRALQGTRHTNPYAYHDHADHRQRRRPYVPMSIIAARTEVDRKHE